MSETENPFALSADEEREFAALSGSEQAQESDDYEEIATRDPESAAEVAEAEQAKDDPDAEWRSKRRVPVEALIEHRVKLREAEKQIAERDRQFAIAQERLNILMASVQGEQQAAQAQQQAPEPVDEPPDPNQDIFAAFEWQMKENKRIKDQLETIAQMTTRQREEYEQKQALNRFAQEVVAEEQSFKAQKPDYDDAINHVRGKRFQAYKDLGYTDAHAEQMVNHDALRFVAQIKQSGRPIAQTIYEYAMSQGYTPAQARAAAQASEQPRDESGRFQPAQSEKLATVAQAQNRNKSLSSTNGTSGKKELSVSDLASMSDKEFHALIKKDEENGNALFKKALGYA